MTRGRERGISLIVQDVVLRIPTTYIKQVSSVTQTNIRQPEVVLTAYIRRFQKLVFNYLNLSRGDVAPDISPAKALRVSEHDL